MGNPTPQTRIKTSKLDVKPKHRHSGSVSNITITSEDFTSPSRDSNSPASSVSLSSASLKEKRLKRRTRSSLGGTEDFIKELDFLTTSPLKKTSESSGPKERSRPSPKSKLSESAPSSAPSSAAPKVLAPVLEASAKAGVVGTARDRVGEEVNGSIVEKAGSGNGVPSGGEKLVSSVEKSVQPCGDGQCAGGPQPGSLVTAEPCKNEALDSVRKFEKNESQVESPLASKDARQPLVAASEGPSLESSTGGSGQRKPMDALPGGMEVSELIADVRPAPESPTSRTSGASSSQNVIEEGLTKSDSSPVQAVILCSGATGDSQVTPRNQLLSKAEQEAKDKRAEEKVSVQKRIEELERIAGGRPVHFRSQSLSLSRPFDICHARHHEAEGPKGFKLPLYQAPPGVNCDSEVDSSKQVATSQSQELWQDAHESEMGALTESIFSAPPVVQSIVDGSNAHENKPESVIKNEEGQLEPPIAIPGTEQRSCKAEPNPEDGPVSPEALTTESLATDNVAVDNHTLVANGLISAESLAVSSKGGDSSSPIKVESVIGSKILEESKTQDAGLVDKVGGVEESEMAHKITTHSAAVEQKVVDIGKEGSSCSPQKEGEEYVVSADLVAEDEAMVTKKLPFVAPPASNPIAEGATLETAEDGVVVEPETDTFPEAPMNGMSAEACQTSMPAEACQTSMPAEACQTSMPAEASQTSMSAEASQTSMLPEAPKTGTLPEAPKTGTGPEVAAVEASNVKQSCQDHDETSVLLTKQPAVDPLFIDSQQDRLWEMHSQELSLRDGESSGPEVKESSAQDEDPNQYANGTPTHAEAAASGSIPNGSTQSDKSSKIDRPRTPLRSLLAEEEAAEKCPRPESGARSTTPQNQIVSPRGNLFRRIVSGGKNSPTKQIPPSTFSPKNQTAAKPFLSSCICCSPVK